MKIKWTVLTCCLLFGMILTAQNQLPEVDLKKLDGRKVNISSYLEEGKVTILNFWATWCQPCKKELDALKTVYPEWEKKYGVKFLAITVDDSRGFPKVKPMVDEKEWPYEVLSDINQEMMRQLNFFSIPQMYLVDGKGIIQHSVTGYVPGSEHELEAKIKEFTK